MDLPDWIDRGTVTGLLFGLFFIAGFLVSGLLVPTGQSQPTEDDGPSSTDDTSFSSQSEALRQAEGFLESQFGNLPFIRNITTVSVNQDRRIEGTEYFYNWTVALTVEPNSFGQWATNTTRDRILNLYVSPDGEYVFSSPPESTDVQQQQAPVGP